MVLKARRRQRQQPIVMDQFLTFFVRQEQFAVPMDQANRVIPLPPIYGDRSGRGVGLVTHGDREILVIDLGRCLFAEPLSAAETEKLKFLLILQPDRDGEWLGFPLMEPPVIERIPREHIHPIPKNYLHWGNIHHVSALMVSSSNDPNLPPIFIVDVPRVLASLQTLQTP
ncbi:chemotaxis protein CheW [Thermosynechococcaceae cyanobacterium Okahandja]